ncbi:RHS repeat-associated core domain-containing protein [Actinoplanes sp. NPDC048988]|uniref:RHS repeat-associated core domain-containing protein n=1 Tax=Actinoplanes sp. NPDC048988 TaxID=3363901 RepID=UPI00371F173F
MQDPASGFTGTYISDEYGNPASGASASARYGWLGDKQRATDALSGLVLMGARLYNSATGSFLQADPIAGASASGYAYCDGDPVNCTDLDGRKPRKCGFFCSVAISTAKTVFGFACRGIGLAYAVCGGLVAGIIDLAKYTYQYAGRGWNVNDAATVFVRAFAIQFIQNLGLAVLGTIGAKVANAVGKPQLAATINTKLKGIWSLGKHRK